MALVCRTYSPGVEKVAATLVVVAVSNVTVPGPLSMVQVKGTLTVPLGVDRVASTTSMMPLPAGIATSGRSGEVMVTTGGASSSSMVVEIENTGSSS